MVFDENMNEAKSQFGKFKKFFELNKNQIETRILNAFQKPNEKNFLIFLIQSITSFNTNYFNLMPEDEQTEIITSIENFQKKLQDKLHEASLNNMISMEAPIRDSLLEDAFKIYNYLSSYIDPYNNPIIINLMQRTMSKFNNKVEKVINLGIDKEADIDKKLETTTILYNQAINAKTEYDEEIQELKRAKEGHIAYHLAKVLDVKSDKYEAKMEMEKSIFFKSLAYIVTLSIFLFSLYFFNNKVHEMDFWKFLSIKFSITAPFIFYAFFCLNEYTKAKRLYEEFDYKRIMAQTLMNNYNRLKEDFTQDHDKLLDLLKTPIEKIFDNPVHSVYGDKSGDKGLGIDQLEKLVSIASKFKDKKD